MKAQRELDGIYFRVERDGKWGNICFSDLTEEEMDQVLEKKNDEWVTDLSKMLLNVLCGIKGQYETNVFDRKVVVEFTKTIGKRIYEFGEQYDIKKEDLE